MHLLQFATLFLATAHITHAFSLPPTKDVAHLSERHTEQADAVVNVFEKRRGGGGRGGFSGSIGSGSSRSSSSSSSSSSGFTGVRPSFAGGTAFRGGSPRAYSRGARSPSGLVPFILVGGALAFYPGFLYGAYAYNWNDDVTYNNETANEQQTAQVSCLCGKYDECGCDENDSDYIQSIIGNGSYAALQQNGIVVLDAGSSSASSLRLHRQDLKTLVINGTLPNGTAEGNTGAAFGRAGLLENAGWWVVVALVGSLAWLA